MIRESLVRSAAMLLLLIIGVAYVTEAVSAQATERTEIEFLAPTPATVGDEVELKAIITVGGDPVANVEVDFLRFTQFMNAGNDLLIGTSVTDRLGIASVTYIPRSEGEILITAEVRGGDEVRPAFTDATINISTGPGLFQEEAGISVPGINIALLAAVLSAIWGTFMYVMFLIWRIAREGSLEASVEGEGSE